MRGTENYSRWWLRIETDFVSDPVIKHIEKKFGGAGVWIYIKMMLASLKQGQMHFSDDACEDLAEAIAITIDEDVDLTREIYQLAVRKGAIKDDIQACEMTQARELSGGESASAERQRRYREKKQKEARNAEPSQSNNEPLQGDRQASQCNAQTLQSDVIREYKNNSNNNNNNYSNSQKPKESIAKAGGKRSNLDGIACMRGGIYGLDFSQ